MRVKGGVDKDQDPSREELLGLLRLFRKNARVNDRSMHVVSRLLLVHPRSVRLTCVTHSRELYSADRVETSPHRTMVFLGSETHSGRETYIHQALVISLAWKSQRRQADGK